MSSMENSTDTPTIPTDARPLGWWLHAITPALRHRMRATLEDAGVTRRQWRILTSLHAGAKSVDERAGAESGAPVGLRRDASADGRQAVGFPFTRHGRFDHAFAPFGRQGFGPHRGERGPRRPLTEILAGLAERGWVEPVDSEPGNDDHRGDAWRLTPTGEAEHDRILAKVSAVRATVRENISDEDWATTMSVLERVAGNLRR